MKSLFCVLVAVTALASGLAPVHAQAPAQGRGAPPPPPTPREAGPIDLTGYWVSVVTEDWRYRMVTPAKGDVLGVPLNDAGLKIANAWDPAKDDASGNQCKSYGAAGLMRLPGRLRISWADDRTLRVEADAGTQTRLLRFGTPGASSPPSWQGQTVAEWQARPQRGGGSGGRRFGSLRTVTTRLRPGYLRKNGVPYSDSAVLTEHWDVVRLPNDGQMLVVTSEVQDPVFLTQPFLTSSNFQKQTDGTGWEPTPCSSTW